MLIHENLTVTSPRDIANTFNKIFLNKVETPTRETNGTATIQPILVTVLKNGWKVERKQCQNLN